MKAGRSEGPKEQGTELEKSAERLSARRNLLRHRRRRKRESKVGRSGGAVASQPGGLEEGLSRGFRQRAMYENLMDEAVQDENCSIALAAVKRNQGAAGIDRMFSESGSD